MYQLCLTSVKCVTCRYCLLSTPWLPSISSQQLLWTLLQHTPGCASSCSCRAAARASYQVGSKAGMFGMCDTCSLTYCMYTLSMRASSGTSTVRGVVLLLGVQVTFARVVGWLRGTLPVTVQRRCQAGFGCACRVRTADVPVMSCLRLEQRR
jgi:hypothetical protein